MRNKVIALALAAALALGVLAGCAKTEQPLEKVTVCEVTHSIFYAPGLF